jgi:iron-sulfur cluster repair protein YtfE (RIC family)
MSIELVKELNGDHRALLKTIGQINDIGTLTPETRSLLKEAKQQLVSHLAREETDFYPVMRKLAATNESIDEKLKVMNMEMETISRSAMRFLDEYITGGIPANFSADFRAFRNALVGRIQREEFALYSHFLKNAH